LEPRPRLLKKKPRLRRSLGFSNNKENFGVLAMALGVTIAVLLCKSQAKKPLRIHNY